MRRGRTWWRLAVAGAVLLAVQIPQGLGQRPDSADLLQLNRQLFESMLLRQDASLFADVAVADVVVIAPGGILENRQQVSAGLKNFRIKSLALDDVQTVIHGETTVVTGLLRPVGEVRGAGPLGPLRFMNVFVRSDGGWRLLARSLTPCAERAIAAGRC